MNPYRWRSPYGHQQTASTNPMAWVAALWFVGLPILTAFVTTAIALWYQGQTPAKDQVVAISPTAQVAAVVTVIVVITATDEPSRTPTAVPTSTRAPRPTPTATPGRRIQGGPNGSLIVPVNPAPAAPPAAITGPALPAPTKDEPRIYQCDQKRVKVEWWAIDWGYVQLLSGGRLREPSGNILTGCRVVE